jgi:tetratricopeptide (TPR) repeat protein
MQRTAELARALCQQAAERHDRADYDAARALYERALALLEGTWGADERQTARCLQGLGRVVMKLGDDSGALSLLEKALAMQERVLGPDQVDTAATLHDMGEVRSNLGDRDTGVALLREAVAIRQRALGADHPDTLESTAVLALLLAQGGDRARAEKMLTGALALCEHSLGEQHLATARVLNALGRFWSAEKATSSRARPMYERALTIYETLLGPGHPLVAVVLNNLAALLAGMKEQEAARLLLERSLTIHEQVYGPANWRTSYVLVNLADVLSDQGNRAAARPLLERALVIRERAWGPEHAETIRALRKLIGALSLLHQAGDESALCATMSFYPILTALEAARGKRDLADKGLPGAHLAPDRAAERLHEEVGRLEARLARPSLTAADQAVLEAAHDLVRQADERFREGDYDAAASHLEKALRLQEGILGQHHLDHVDLLKELAEVRQRQGQYRAVLPLYERVVDIHIQVLGAQHPTTTMALTDLMSHVSYEYGLAAALPLQERVLESMAGALGPDDPLVAMARQTANQTRARLGNPAETGPTGPSRSERREAALAATSSIDQDLLAGVDEVDWHALHHAYGPADDVPNLLRLLLSDDKEVRDDAWQELYSNLWHQGDVYEATGYAVPFFLRLLQAEATPGKGEVLAFLQAVATGVPYLSERHTWMEKVLAEQGRDFRAEIELAQRYAQRAHAAVAEGLETYLALLHGPGFVVREAAFVLLCTFPEHGTRVLPALLSCVELEPEPGPKARLIRHLGLSLPDLRPAGGQEAAIELLE